MMRKIIDAVFFYIAVGLGMFAAAQAPQIPLTGTVGSGGNFAFRNASPVSMTSDANHTMVYPEGSGAFVKVTSTVSLSATRNVIEPFLTNAQCFENSTTGGQAIQIIGASGTGVTIPNGSYACVQGDGTNYHAPNVSDLPLFAPSVVTGNPSAGAVAALPSGAHGSAGDESSTAGVPATGVDYWRWDSTSHCAKGSFNGTAESCAATLLTFAAPPAIGNTTPGPSVTSNLIHTFSACDVTSSALCIPQWREGLNCNYLVSQIYNCGLKVNTWTDPLLTGSATGAAGVDDTKVSYVYGPGIDTGNCDNCGSAIWSGWRGTNSTYQLARRGLDGGTTETFYLDRQGDFQAHGIQVDGIGGSGAASDEGVDGWRGWFSEPGFWTGIEPASGSVDQIYIYSSALASTNNGRTVDYTWLTDVTQQVTGGALNGQASSTGNGYLWSQPVTGLTIAASNWDTCTPGIGQSVGLPRPTVASYTVTCTVQAGSGITTGWAKVGANFGEGVTVTAASAPSGGSQTVTLSANQPQPSGFTIWQNPGSGTSYTGYCGWVNDDFTYTGQKPLFEVFGALDSSHLVIGRQDGAALNGAFPNTGNGHETTSSTFTIAPCAEVVQNIAVNFTGDTTSGSSTVLNVSNTTGIGIGQAVRGPGMSSFGNQVAGISGTTLTLTGPALANATEVQLSTTGGIQLEPHAWTIANGDHLEDPHSPTPREEGAFWTYNTWNTPGSGGASFQSICEGTYCGGKSFRHFSAENRIGIGSYFGGYFPPDAMIESIADQPGRGYFGAGLTMDEAPIRINPDANVGGLVRANDASFFVTATTNGTTTVTVTGFPSPSQICPQVLNERVMAADIPSATTIATCTAGSTNTATLTLSAAATGSNVESMQVLYPVDVWSVLQNGVGAYNATLDPSANSGNGQLNFSVAKMSVNGADVLTTATGAVTGSGTTGNLPKWTSGTVVGNSALDDGVTVAGIVSSTEAISAPSFSGGTVGGSGKTLIGAYPNPGGNSAQATLYSYNYGGGADGGGGQIFMHGENSEGAPLLLDTEDSGHGGGMCYGCALGTNVPLGFVLNTGDLFLNSGNIKQSSGTVHSWNNDTGLSRDAAGVVDVGNGTAGDTSGTINATTVNAGLGNFGEVTLPSSLVGNAVVKFGSGAGLSGNSGSIFAGNGSVADDSAIFYAAAYRTQGVCNSAASPALCVSDSSGAVAVPAGGTTLVVDTTAVTANSQIHLTFDSSLGSLLGATCNTSINQPTVSARTAGTSFTITMSGSITTNPDCISYTIVN